MSNSVKTDREEKKELGRFRDYRCLYYVGEKIPHRRVFKYYDIDTAVKCLAGNNIRFAQPNEWPDGYESRFYKADYRKKLKKADLSKLTPRLFATCFTSEKSSEAAWYMYSRGEIKRRSRCVQFRINLKKLREQLDGYAKKEDCLVYEGVTDYKSEYYISGLHYERINEKYPDAYKKYFSDFSLYNYLKLLLLKREAFEYEKECRFFLIPKNQNFKTKYIDLVINWPDIIEAISVEKGCNEALVRKLKDACKEAKIKLEVKTIDFYKKTEESIVIGDTIDK